MCSSWEEIFELIKLHVNSWSGLSKAIQNYSIQEIVVGWNVFFCKKAQVSIGFVWGATLVCKFVQRAESCDFEDVLCIVFYLGGFALLGLL